MDALGEWRALEDLRLDTEEVPDGRRGPHDDARRTDQVDGVGGVLGKHSIAPLAACQGLAGEHLLVDVAQPDDRPDDVPPAISYRPGLGGEPAETAASGPPSALELDRFDVTAELLGDPLDRLGVLRVQPQAHGLTQHLTRVDAQDALHGLGDPRDDAVCIRAQDHIRRHLAQCAIGGQQGLGGCLAPRGVGHVGEGDQNACWWRDRALCLRHHRCGRDHGSSVQRMRRDVEPPGAVVEGAVD